MTNIENLRKIYDEHQRRNVDLASSIREEMPSLVRYTFQAGKLICVILYSDLNENDVEMAIRVQVTHARLVGVSLEWKHFNYDKPDDLKERLLTHGFSPEDGEAVMVLSIADAPEKLKQPVSHDIRRITEPKKLADADRVVYKVWKDDPFWDGSRQGASQYILPMWEADPESCSVYIAYVDEQPVSYSRIDFPRNNPFASIWGGSTLPDYRGRGLYSALIAARLQEAEKRGYQYLTVDANPETSMPILQKLGFVTIGYATAFNLEVEKS
jgi:GNAT superfamily N-acetyltransferase